MSRTIPDYITDTADRITQLLHSFPDKQLNVALSGGSTPLPVYEALAEKQLPWENLRFFMVDERCVDPAGPDSNYGNISSCFLDHVPSTSFPMVSEGDNYEVMAEAYDKLLLNELPIVSGFPQFDLVILGMGLDGHTASLFPGTLGLFESERSVILNEVPQLDTSRITLTYPVILNASKRCLLIRGEEKQKVLEASRHSDLPISRVLSDCIIFD